MRSYRMNTNLALLSAALSQMATVPVAKAEATVEPIDLAPGTESPTLNRKQRRAQQAIRQRAKKRK